MPVLCLDFSTHGTIDRLRSGEAHKLRMAGSDLSHQRQVALHVRQLRVGPLQVSKPFLHQDTERSVPVTHGRQPFAPRFFFFGRRLRLLVFIHFGQYQHAQKYDYIDIDSACSTCWITTCYVLRMRVQYDVFVARSVHCFGANI